MKKWGYLIVHDITKGQLNHYGSKGWELVNVRTGLTGNISFYFKREKSE